MATTYLLECSISSFTLNLKIIAGIHLLHTPVTHLGWQTIANTQLENFNILKSNKLNYIYDKLR